MIDWDEGQSESKMRPKILTRIKRNVIFLIIENAEREDSSVGG